MTPGRPPPPAGHDRHDHAEASSSGFCPRCGTPLEAATAAGRPPACPACEYVRYENPKLATGVVVEHQGAILLVRRNHDPMYGRWSFPSGFVDRGEVVEEAARREVREETALEVTIDRLLGVYSSAGDPVVFVAYAGHSSGGAPEAGPEAIEVGLFPPDGLPELAFLHDTAIVEAWRRATREPNP